MRSVDGSRVVLSCPRSEWCCKRFFYLHGVFFCLFGVFLHGFFTMRRSCFFQPQISGGRLVVTLNLLEFWKVQICYSSFLPEPPPPKMCEIDICANWWLECHQKNRSIFFCGVRAGLLCVVNDHTAKEVVSGVIVMKNALCIFNRYYLQQQVKYTVYRGHTGPSFTCLTVAVAWGLVLKQASAIKIRSCR